MNNITLRLPDELYLFLERDEFKNKTQAVYECVNFAVEVQKMLGHFDAATLLDKMRTLEKLRTVSRYEISELFTKEEIQNLQGTFQGIVITPDMRNNSTMLLAILDEKSAPLKDRIRGLSAAQIDALYCMIESE